MKHILLSLLISSFVHAEWEAMPPMPEAAGGFAAGCVKGKIIVAGGTNWAEGTKHWLDTVWVFDPAEKKWSAGPMLPNAIAYAAFVSDGEQLFIAGGADGKAGRKEVLAVDAEMRFKKIGELGQAVVFGAAALQNEALQVFGGSPDPDDWSKMGTALVTINTASGAVTNQEGLKLDHGLGLSAVFTSGERLLSFTGAWFDAQQQVHNADAAYAHEKQHWTTLKSYPLPARGVMGVAIDDSHIYLGGGYGTDEQGFLSQAYVYDVKANRYTPAPPLPFAATTCLVKCGEHVYVIGGEDQKKHRTALAYRILARQLLEPTK